MKHRMGVGAMMRQITGSCFGNGVAQVRVITTREEASDSESYFYQLTNLYQQLTDRRPAKHLVQLVGPNLSFIFLTDASNLVGSATLAVVRTAIRCKGLVEDVVVHQGYRNGGLGKILLEEVIKLGKQKGCQYLQLTSKPERQGTSCFYPKLGFEPVAFARPNHPDGTNLYKYNY